MRGAIRLYGVVLSSAVDTSSWRST